MIQNRGYLEWTFWVRNSDSLVPGSCMMSQLRKVFLCTQASSVNTTSFSEICQSLIIASSKYGLILRIQNIYFLEHPKNSSIILIRPFQNAPISSHTWLDSAFARISRIRMYDVFSVWPEKIQACTYYTYYIYITAPLVGSALRLVSSKERDR